MFQGKNLGQVDSGGGTITGVCVTKDCFADVCTVEAGFVIHGLNAVA
jgi:hypothetical protein